VSYHCRPNKACSTSDQNFHVYFALKVFRNNLLHADALATLDKHTGRRK
jgi:hypothetical protein